MKQEQFIKDFPVNVLRGMRTPFYYYDMDLLRATLSEVNRLTVGTEMRVHYAVKANGNPRILSEIRAYGLGADLVSGGEIKAALDAGFRPEHLAFSGVGKTDWEIQLGLQHDIGCFNVESIPELETINQWAIDMGKTAQIAFRVNPNIDAHTHRYITTGTIDNKFGIGLDEIDEAVDMALLMPHVHLRGLHFHIGSQITQMEPYALLCETVNRLQEHFEERGIHFEMINVGGGLGIDYDHPDEHTLPDLEAFFGTFKRGLKLRDGQELHFELGRSIVGACGSLISRVTYVKQNRCKSFVILDAGMNDLVRPALYQALHQVQNLTSAYTEKKTYDVVGPVCESSDVFAHDCLLPVTERGDLIAIRSAGAYGESMSSTYNMRPLPQSVFSDSI